MRQSLAIASMLVLIGGCSLIYNPNDLGKPVDARTIDAPVDAPIVRDADPTMLVIDDVFPKVIYGGQGSGGSFPVTLAIHGHNFVDGFMLAITPTTQAHVVGTPMRSFDGNWIAAQVEVDAVDSTAASSLTIAVSEPDDAMGDLKSFTLTPDVLMLQNAPELNAAATIDAATLETTVYSMIDAPTLTITNASSQRLIFKSYSSITLGTLAAAGASGDAGGAPGPGGCPGGLAGNPAGCPTAEGGGGGAASSNGGGGGGFTTDGSEGTQGVIGGAQHGYADLVNLDPDANHSDTNTSGGGGGGNVSGLNLGATAGGGGGGGGTVEVSAGGTINLTSIDVSGGGGGAGKAGTLPTANAGGGGGGSGGVIIIRSAASTVTVGTLLSKAGTAGMAGGGGAGGAGSVGRIRVDTSGAIPTSPGVSIHRGPAFAPDTLTITTDINQMVTVTGQAGDTLTLYDRDGGGMVHAGEPMASFDSTGNASIRLSLLDGYNQICATLDTGVAGNELADTCFELVYLP